MQLAKLNNLLAAILPANSFYVEKLAANSLQLGSLDELSQLPYTYKDELAAPPFAHEFAANLTFPLARYVRFHRTSGTQGKPLPVLDTAEDWQWWMETWQYILDAADVGPGDRVLMAFSFGPFIGFWSAHEAALTRGAMVIPGGGLTTLGRLELMRICRPTIVCCTPSYALHLAEVAWENQIDPRTLGVRSLIVAGEPGGSLPEVRGRIEAAFDARVSDHAGASEVGPWGYADDQRRGLRIIESEFIAEFISHQTGQPANEGELAELVLTTLGRVGSPVLRYRTGDLVRPVFANPGENQFVLLEGGVLGRTDDMLIIRGVNVIPSALDQIMRSFPEVVEYRATAVKQGAMDELRIEVEDRLENPERIIQELQLRLGLKVFVGLAPAGSLPRFEGKGRRLVDER